MAMTASGTETGTPKEQSLRRRIIDQLVWDPRVSSADVQVTVDNSMAILTGTAPSLCARIAATRAAWSVWGISAVENRLRVVPGAKADNAIKHRVENVLEADPFLEAGDVTVAVEAGRVLLRGTVDAFWKKRHAEEHAVEVRDVVEVTNEIVVVPTRRWSDEEVANDLEEALGRNANVDAEDVNVEVSYGKVTLIGTVSSWTVKREARETVWYTLGVTDVDDRLMVHPAPFV